MLNKIFNPKSVNTALIVKKTSKVNRKVTIGIVTASIIGLALVAFIVIAGIPSTHKGTVLHIHQQMVRVTGAVSEKGISSIQFISQTGVIYTASPNSKGAYSISLPGGQSYTVGLLDKYGKLQETTFLDVPSGVTTFHADL